MQELMFYCKLAFLKFSHTYTHMHTQTQTYTTHIHISMHVSVRTHARTHTDIKGSARYRIIMIKTVGV